MPHDNDTSPLTPEKAIKLKAHEYIMRMKNTGVPWAYVTNAAVVMVLELKTQYFKSFTGSQAERNKKMQQFEQLEKDIIAYLPTAKAKAKEPTY